MATEQASHPTSDALLFRADASGKLFSPQVTEAIADALRMSPVEEGASRFRKRLTLERDITLSLYEAEGVETPRHLEIIQKDKDETTEYSLYEPTNIRVSNDSGIVIFSRESGFLDTALTVFTDGEVLQTSHIPNSTIDPLAA